MEELREELGGKLNMEELKKLLESSLNILTEKELNTDCKKYIFTPFLAEGIHYKYTRGIWMTKIMFDESIIPVYNILSRKGVTIGELRQAFKELGWL